MTCHVIEDTTMRHLRVLTVGALCLLSLAAGCAMVPVREEEGPWEQKGDYTVYSEWPFNHKEARRRQSETAKALGLPAQKTIDLPGGVRMEMVLIPAGEFMMGSSDSAEEIAHRFGVDQPELFQDESPCHRVRISCPFYLGKCEVTQEQWQALTGTNPSQFKDLSDSLRRPVESVLFNEIKTRFLLPLKVKMPERWSVRLPTEAEWEYACRAGTDSPFHFGDTMTAGQANYHTLASAGDTDRGETVPVGRFGANAWGLHDVHGNVWEYCEDRYHEGFYGVSPGVDPCNLSWGDHHVLRGGSWNYPLRYCRSAHRGWDAPGPNERYAHRGFRVLLSFPVRPGVLAKAK